MERLDLFSILLRAEKFQIKVPDVIPKEYRDYFPIVQLAGARPIMALVGDYSAGKSSMINLLMGKDLLPTDTDRTTSFPNLISKGQENEVILKVMGSDAIKIDMELWEQIKDSLRHGSQSVASSIDFAVMKIKEHPFELIFLDTPGYSGSEEDMEKTLRFINIADRVILVKDASKGSLSDSDLKLLESIGDKLLLILMNKADKVDEENIYDIIESVRQQAEEVLGREVSVLPFSINELETYKPYEFQLLRAILQVENRLKCSGIAREIHEITGGRFIESGGCDMMIERKSEIYKSIELYEKALKVKGDDDKILFKLGKLYEEAGNIGKAMKLYEKAWKLNKSNTDPLLALAKLHIEQEDFDSARDLIAELSSINPDIMDYYMGILNYRMGNFEAALNNFNASAEKICDEEKYGSNIYTFCLKSNFYIYLLGGEKVKCDWGWRCESYLSSIEDFSIELILYVYRGLSEICKSSFSKFIDKFIKRKFYRFLVYCGKEYNDEARSYFYEMTRKYPHNIYYKMRLDFVLKNKDYNFINFLHTIVNNHKAAMEDPQNVENWLKLGMAYEEGALFRDAIRAYKKALLLDKNNPVALQGLGAVYERMANGEKGLEFPF